MGPQVCRCSECGSTEVQITAWIDANTEERAGEGSEGPLDYVFCPQCEGTEGGYEYDVPTPAEEARFRRAREVTALKFMRTHAPHLFEEIVQSAGRSLLEEVLADLMKSEVAS
jgi:hypothetical protein